MSLAQGARATMPARAPDGGLKMNTCVIVYEEKKPIRVLGPFPLDRALNRAALERDALKKRNVAGYAHVNLLEGGQ